MKKQHLPTLAIALFTSISFIACNGLQKMVKNSNLVTYEVTPKALEMHADSVLVNISGKYPAKFFAKKAVLTVTPSIVYANGEKTLKPITLVGEKAVGNGTKIMYEKGGNFSYTDKVAYQPEMKIATLNIKAVGAVKSKTKDFPSTKIADGTIITPLLVKSDEKALIAKDNFQRIIPVTSTANIYFIVNQSNVRPTEMNNAEMKTMKDFITKGVQKQYTFKNMNVSAYASPDGEQTLNANLADNRAKETIKALQTEFKKLKTTVGTQEDFYNKVTTAEDWDGFKTAMEASSIPDKDLILRVLTMYPDGETREKEIKNLSKTYTVVADQILPKLRRAVLTLNAEEKSKTDEQLTQLAAQMPDSLSVEELLYAATLINDMNAKLNIYKAAERLYSQDWRCANNVGYIYIMQNKITDAQAAFERANKLKANNTIVLNNLGIVARWKGDTKAATDYYKAAMGAGSEVSYNMGIIDIMNGNYANAVANFGKTNSFNAALARVLSGNPETALNIIDASSDKDAALAYYLKAIVGAKTGKNDLMINNLKTAVTKDASFKMKAKEDCEFLKFRENADFKAVIE